MTDLKLLMLIEHTFTFNLKTPEQILETLLNIVEAVNISTAN